MTTEAGSMSPLTQYLAQDRELAPHLRAALERLSSDHPSGIPADQRGTPMMKQFLSAKDEVPDCLVFFRMGDFFELFGADAVIVSDVCGLTLTSRDKGSECPVPMAGVPAGSYRSSVKKCLLAGFKVAVVDQVEDPRQAKGIVRREIVRIATPAVPGDLEEESEDAVHGTFLAAAHETSVGWTFACVDVSTGDFRLTGRLSRESLEQEILTIRPRELLVSSDRLQKTKERLRQILQPAPVINAIDSWIFRSERDCRALFEEFFSARALNGFGVLDYASGLQVVSGILSYLKATQRSVLQNVKTIQTYEMANHMVLDANTKRHLDFFATAGGEKKGSLYCFLNRCVTAGGSRLLVRRLNYPFLNRADIEDEQARIASLVADSLRSDFLTEVLRNTADVERLLSRTAQGSLDPRGMAWLRQTLIQAPHIAEILGEMSVGQSLQSLMESLAEPCRTLSPLRDLLERALVDDPPSLLGKGSRVFREGFSPELDEVTALESNFDDMIGALEKREKERSHISTLKIGFTRVFGYYFEVSRGKVAQVPDDFIRKQTLANAERYTTDELKELESRWLTASERRATLERELFESVRQEILQYAESISNLGHALAHIDLVRSFAAIARDGGWCRPRLVDECITELRGCVHPVLAGFMGSDSPFVANDIVVGKAGDGEDRRVLLITGPNMAGKSTVMRQAALVQVLAQMGSFVPAREAVLGVCDRVFTRIGSGDFALRNQSTFMVEMLESAAMLRSATSRSLLLMDELGRGTSTYDGLSLAWAILEDLHDRIGARALFSTHYHELVDVAQDRPGIRLMQMEVIERDRGGQDKGTGAQEILFSYRFVDGAAGQSYGLHVAELAGMDVAVVSRAAQVLESLHEADGGGGACVVPQVAAVPVMRPGQRVTDLSERDERVLRRLQALLVAAEPNGMTPLEALQMVFTWRQTLDYGKKDALWQGVDALNHHEASESSSRRSRKKTDRGRAGAVTLFD